MEEDILIYQLSCFVGHPVFDWNKALLMIIRLFEKTVIIVTNKTTRNSLKIPFKGSDRQCTVVELRM